MDLGC